MFISAFAISGYRSLKNIELRGMLPICVLHGLNNSGKSNILSAIETIFRRKVQVEETTLGETTKHEREGSFWQGIITNFKDNFYMNGREDIKYSISITFADNELAFMNDILEKLKPFLAQPGHDKILILNGRMTYIDDNAAEMVLDKAAFNKHYVVFEADAAGKKSFFPSIKGLAADKQLLYFEKLMNLLANSFRVLSSDRYLTSELLSSESGQEIALTPKTFKGWLFKLSLSRGGHDAFEEIRKMFVSDPFSVGEIGFSQEREEIEIMVKEQNVRLPISRLGSGYQQILYIIANLVLNKKKMLGIEELEINLSPRAQKILFDKLKKHIYTYSDLLTQLIITSHSDVFEFRKDVRVYGVEHNGKHTTVTQWSQMKRKRFFSLK
jgi:hypothetical protein